jgi:hypothetical protein
LFDTVFESEGIEIVDIPFEAPNANAIAERWVRSVREECLDKLIILNERHLRRVLTEYLSYYNARRPHQGLDQDSPLGLTVSTEGPIRSRNELGGIIRDYYRELPDPHIPSHSIYEFLNHTPPITAPNARYATPLSGDAPHMGPSPIWAAALWNGSSPWLKRVANNNDLSLTLCGMPSSLIALDNPLLLSYPLTNLKTCLDLPPERILKVIG